MIVDKDEALKMIDHLQFGDGAVSLFFTGLAPTY